MRKRSNKPGAGEVVIFEEPTGFTSGSTTIYNMQDMTNSICNGAADGATGRLRDTRDKKVYWVTKFKNMCWMTQNLDLDLYEDLNLTSADTDVASAVTLATTQKGVPAFGTGAGTTQSFDPGYYVYSNITATGACTSTSLSNCNGFTNILNGIWKSSDDPNFAGAINDSTNTYNAHYLIGNYYSYAAATAGTGPSAAGAAEHSICPKGWRLPTGGNNTGEFYSTFNGMSVANIVASPYYFVYGGLIGNSSITSAGSEGRYWSSTAYNASQAYLLYFVTSVTPSYSNYRYIGNSVRCVAR